MPMPYQITLRGLEEYMNQLTPPDSLFADVELPVGLDKDDLISTIMKATWDLESLCYDPYLLKDDIARWFAIHYNDFDKMVDAILADYDPLFNYRKKIHKKVYRDGEDHYTNHNRAEGDNTNDGWVKPGSMTTSKRAAFDSNTFENYDQVAHSGEDNHHDKDIHNNENWGNGDSNFKNQDTTDSDITGLTGQYAIQDLLRRELVLREDFNIYELITKMFKQEFCLLIY